MWRPVKPHKGHSKRTLLQSNKSSPHILFLPAENRASLICFVKDKIWVEKNMGLPKNKNAFYPKGKRAMGTAALVPKFLQSCHFLASE